MLRHNQAVLMRHPLDARQLRVVQCDGRRERTIGARDVHRHPEYLRGGRSHERAALGQEVYVRDDLEGGVVSVLRMLREYVHHAGCARLLRHARAVHQVPQMMSGLQDIWVIRCDKHMQIAVVRMNAGYIHNVRMAHALQWRVL